MTEKEFYESLNNSADTYQSRGFAMNNKERGLNDAYPVLMRKVYTWMALALAITGIIAYGVASSPAFVSTIFSSSTSVFLLCAVEVGLVLWLSARINKLSLATATLLFILYSVVNGVTMSVIFLAYTMASIAKVFFITAGTFGIMAAYGYTTKKDLSSMGKICFFALIGMILATIVNYFTHSTMLQYILSYVGVAVFMGLTAWDTQKIKEMLQDYAYDLSESSQKIALLGALNLYLDFINLFIYLLRIFGSNRD